MISSVWIKVILLTFLFISTFIVSLIPLKINSYLRKPGVRRSRKIILKSALSLLSCFSAGVFIATCLLDLLPSVQNKLAAGFLKLGLDPSFPVGEFVLVFGFFIIFTVEQFILTVKESDPDAELSPLLDGTDSVSVTSSQDNLNSGAYGSVSSDPSNNNRNEDLNGDNVGTEDEDKQEQYADPSSQSVIRSMILVCALSLHSFLEGMAIGLQVGTNDILEIFLPVALHKTILAFAVGLNLVQSKLQLKSIVKSDLIFSVTSPIGIAIGTIIIVAASNSPDTAMINGVLEGLACGTFLFVVFFEILPHEFMTKKKRPNRLLKTLFLILGFTAITLILLIHPDSKPTCASFIKPT